MIPTLSVPGPQGQAGGAVPTWSLFGPGAEDNINDVLYMLNMPLGNAVGATNSNDAVAAASAANSGVVKAGPGRLYQVIYYNDNAALRYFQLFNTTTLPADTAVPLWSIGVATKGTLILPLGPFGKFFPIGICACHSTTYGTKTIGGADGDFHLEFK